MTDMPDSEILAAAIQPMIVAKKIIAQCFIDSLAPVHVTQGRAETFAHDVMFRLLAADPPVYLCHENEIISG